MDFIINFLKNYVIPLLVLILVLSIFFLILKRLHYEFIKPFRDNVTNKAEVFLTEMILSNPDKITLKRKLKAFKNEIPFNRGWCKKLIVNDMIRTKQNIKGKAADSIILIYKALQLNKYSSKLMRNFLDSNKCEGLYHFQSLNYKNSLPQIKPFLDNSSKIIKSNATMAYISLTDGDMSVFNEFNSKLSLLNIIKIMDIYQDRKLPIPKNIDNWILSPNASIIQLGIKTMVFYNYLNQSEEIIKLINYQNETIKKEAIIAVRDLYLYEAEGDLIRIFDISGDEIKFEILVTLKIIGKEKTITFLKNEINTEINLDLKLKAVDCLNMLQKAELDNMAFKDPELEKMILHVRNKYIV